MLKSQANSFPQGVLITNKTIHKESTVEDQNTITLKEDYVSAQG